MIRGLAFAVVPALLTLGAGQALAATTVAVPTVGLYTASDADAVCYGEANTARWNGHWNTTEWGRMSVCGCTVGGASQATFDVEAGPLWNHGHAQQVCPQVCESARWTGHWTRQTRYQPASCTLAYSGHIRGAVRVAAPVVVTPAPRFVRTPPRRVVRSPRVVHTRYAPVRGPRGWRR